MLPEFEQTSLELCAKYINSEFKEVLIVLAYCIRHIWLFNKNFIIRVPSEMKNYWCTVGFNGNIIISFNVA